MYSINDLVLYVSQQFIKDILNSMTDWVRIIDFNSKIIFANKSMIAGLGKDPTGDTCYRIFKKSNRCENCISQKSILENNIFKKEEVINDRYFSILSSPIKNNANCIIAVLEILRDVTNYKKLQNDLQIKNSHYEKELTFAKTIQSKLLPWDFSSKDIQFSFKYIPSQYLSGDLLDIFYIDKDHIGLYIADVSGHGASSALLTVYIYSKFCKSVYSPAKALESLYTDFNSTNMNEKLYITIFYMIIDLKNKTLIYSNAGHSAPPILFENDSYDILRVPGIPISNWLKKPDYIDHKKKLSSNNKIFLYTDGITELKNEETSKQFSEEKMLKLIKANIFNIEVTLDLLINEIYNFKKNNIKFNDDITFAILELN
ncbi:MAG: SpoIIE family protein phosphatase [Clostridiales bacterium]